MTEGAMELSLEVAQPNPGSLASRSRGNAAIQRTCCAYMRRRGEQVGVEVVGVRSE